MKWSANAKFSPKRRRTVSPDLAATLPVTPSAPLALAPRQASRSPPPEAVVLQLYEGRAVLQIEKYLNAFENLCKTYSAAGNEEYVLQGNYLAYALKSEKSAFAIVALRAGQPIGFLKGSVWARFQRAGRLAGTRVAVVDVLCTQGRAPVKGIGGILLAEAERYATDGLGASLMLLFSVMNPATVRFYLSKGYARTLNACAPSDNAVARKSFTEKRRLAGFDVLYSRALDRKFFEGFNDVNDTVVMTKCLAPAPRKGYAPVEYGGPGNRATFLKNAAFQLALYAPNAAGFLRRQAVRLHMAQRK